MFVPGKLNFVSYQFVFRCSPLDPRNPLNYEMSLHTYTTNVKSILGRGRGLLCFRRRLFIGVLWSPAGKGLTSWLSFVMSNCVFVTFPCGILGQVRYLIVSIPYLCPLSYLYKLNINRFPNAPVFII